MHAGGHAQQPQSTLFACIHACEAAAAACLGAHVPDAADGVPAAGHEQVQLGVQRERVAAAPVPVVVPDDLPPAAQLSEKVAKINPCA